LILEGAPILLITTKDHGGCLKDTRIIAGWKDTVAPSPFICISTGKSSRVPRAGKAKSFFILSFYSVLSLWKTPLKYVIALKALLQPIQGAVFHPVDFPGRFFEDIPMVADDNVGLGLLEEDFFYFTGCLLIKSRGGLVQQQHLGIH